jgi:AcrR family transcriptional regulator
VVDNETQDAILFQVVTVVTPHLRLVDTPSEERGLHVVAEPSVGKATPQRVRIADAASRCIARKGIAKTTLDDVASEAGCSRATVYRTFPGGKEEVMSAVVDTEVARLFSSVAVEMGRADDLEDAIVAGVVASATIVQEHPALQYVLDNEPGVVLASLCFEPMTGVLDLASHFASPFLSRWLDPEAATRVADFAARIVLSHVATPAPGVNLRDPQSVRRLVGSFVMPAARKLANEPNNSID